MRGCISRYPDAAYVGEVLRRAEGGRRRSGYLLHSPSTSPSLITPGLKLSIWSEAGVLPCPSAPNRWHSFHLDDVRPLPWSRPVATFMAKDRFYYIDTYRCRGLAFTWLLRRQRRRHS